MKVLGIAVAAANAVLVVSLPFLYLEAFASLTEDLLYTAEVFACAGGGSLLLSLVLVRAVSWAALGIAAGGGVTLALGALGGLLFWRDDFREGLYAVLALIVLTTFIVWIARHIHWK